MVVKHIGANGDVRRTFENVNIIRQHQGNNIVSLNRQIVYVNTVGGIPTGAIDERQGMPPLRPFDTDYPIAMIHLAPGESVERADEPTRR